MLNTISGRNTELTDTIKSVVDKKMSRLDKYFNKEMPATVTLSVEGKKQENKQSNRQIVEITVPFLGTIVRAEEASEDMYVSLDKAIDVLERQIRKHKEKLKIRKHTDETIRFENIVELPESDVEEEGEIVKVKRFILKPMNKEEAVLQMELIGHAFYMFENGETGNVNLVYKRKDGHYGLIEPEYLEY